MPGIHIPALVRDAAASRRREVLAWQVALADSPTIEAVVFDAYGTLLDLTSLETACRSLTPEPAAFVAQWRAKQLEYSWLRALMSNYADFAQVTRDALDYTLAHFAVGANDKTVRALLAAWLTLEPYPEVPGTLARLQGLPLAILSNGSPAMLAAAIKHARLSQHFDAVLSADAAHTYKPDPRVYALAPAALKLAPDQILLSPPTLGMRSGPRATASVSPGATAPVKRETRTAPHPTSKSARSTISLRHSGDEKSRGYVLFEEKEKGS